MNVVHGSSKKDDTLDTLCLRKAPAPVLTSARANPYSRLKPYDHFELRPSFPAQRRGHQPEIAGACHRSGAATLSIRHEPCGAFTPFDRLIVPASTFLQPPTLAARLPCLGKTGTPLESLIPEASSLISASEPMRALMPETEPLRQVTIVCCWFS